MNLHFTPCSMDDLERVQHFGRATYEPYYPHIWKSGGLDFYMEHCFGTATLRAQLQDPNIAYFLPTMSDGTVIGLLKLFWHKPVPDAGGDNALFLEKIYLMPNFMGHGYGQKFMEFVFQKARSLGRDYVWLTVMKTGPEAAYLKAGFERKGIVTYDFDLILPEERSGWVMVKAL
jgi:diamine N-acetyltransferase